VLVGLKGRSELNGKEGTIAGDRPARADGALRFPVAVEGEGKPIAVQPVNLRLSVPEKPQSEPSDEALATALSAAALATALASTLAAPALAVALPSQDASPPADESPL
jgi:hypothetical protein